MTATSCQYDCLSSKQQQDVMDYCRWLHRNMGQEVDADELCEYLLDVGCNMDMLVKEFENDYDKDIMDDIVFSWENFPTNMLELDGLVSERKKHFPNYTLRQVQSISVIQDLLQATTTTF